MSLLNDFQSQEIPQVLENGEYLATIRNVREVYTDKSSSVVVEFSVAGYSACVPNKIRLTQIANGDRVANRQKFFLAVTKFCKCFGINEQTEVADYKSWLGKTGKIKVADGADGYKDVVLLYTTNAANNPIF